LKVSVVYMYFVVSTFVSPDAINLKVLPWDISAEAQGYLPANATVYW